MASQDVALRKRQQIAKASRMMFLWVMVISALVGISVVVSIFLVQKLIFNEKVLAEKQTTATILRNNNESISELKENVRVLNTNQALLDSRAKEEDTPLQVVLDALPADANSSALGASLQEVLLRADNVTIDALSVVSSEESDTTSSVPSSIEFTFTVSAPADKANSLRELLRRLERSIRAIDIQSLTIETQGSRLVLSANATAYYEPAKTTELKDKTVQP